MGLPFLGRGIARLVRAVFLFCGLFRAQIVLAYAASTLLHAVVLGSLVAWCPWGNSEVGFSVEEGNGGMGDQPSPIGSAGGSATTEVIRFELLRPIAARGETVAAAPEPST